MFRPAKNTPFLPKEAKQLMTKHITEASKKPPPPVEKPLLDLQMYQPVTKKPYEPVDPAHFGQIHAPNPMAYQYPWSGQGQGMAKLPLVKYYNIQTSGPQDSHAMLAKVYEDMLPSSTIPRQGATLGERLSLHEFIRSTLLRDHDGEIVTIDGSGNSLLRFIKFLEVNPYHSNPYQNNPYKTLPDGMLLYRSCYPIRFDLYGGKGVDCARNSIGFNIRMYRMTVGEMHARQNGPDWNDSNIWREIQYYEFVRERIIKPKRCPNFVILETYHMAPKSKVDFDGISRLRGVKESFKPPFADVPLKPEDKIMKSLIPGVVRVKENPLKQSVNMLIAVTEAPTYNALYGWARQTYLQQGKVEKMINRGFHSHEEWISFYFQLSVALYVMQKEKICFNEFTMKDNVFVKDVTNFNDKFTYWKYIVNDVEYYVPNYGCLAMLDTNFKDTSNGKRFKIDGTIYELRERSDKQIQDLCFQAFRDCISPNNFTAAFTKAGGAKLPDDTHAFLTRMYAATGESGASHDINHYIEEFFKMLLHNRIGAFLNDSEVKNIRKDDKTPFKKGQLVCREIRYDTYTWAIYVGKDGGMAKILTKSKPKESKIITDTIGIGSLFNYFATQPVEQEYKKEKGNFAESNMLEVYQV
jgi:hypothetical protein